MQTERCWKKGASCREANGAECWIHTLSGCAAATGTHTASCATVNAFTSANTPVLLLGWVPNMVPPLWSWAAPWLPPKRFTAHLEQCQNRTMERLKIPSLVFSLCWEEQTLWEHHIIGTCPVLLVWISCPSNPEHWGVNIAFSLEHKKMEKLEFKAGTACRLGCSMLGFQIVLWHYFIVQRRAQCGGWKWREGTALAGSKNCPFW